MDVKRIFLCGMPGCGKTTVGKILAEFLKLNFYDLDDFIEREKGVQIKEIFSKYGESKFREFERELFSKLKEKENCVIALGGGSILNKDILDCIIKRGNYSFYIETDLGKLERRIKKSFVRPVLKNLDDIRKLYENRKPFYEKVRYKVDGNKSPQEVSLQILSKLKFSLHRKVSEKPHNFYLGNVQSFLEMLENNNQKVFLITHKKIKELISYFYDISRFELILVPEGELAKSIECFERVLRILIDKKADRSSLILGIGGGVIGDLAGFVSSVFMRGTKLALIPSTLLAAVDAHLGGKNALNFYAKNVIGTFKFPEVVFCDPRLFITLGVREIVNGFAEILKTALLDQGVYTSLRREIETVLSPNLETYLKWVPLIAKLKLKVVKEDPFELKIKRKILNSGHTIGHVIEASSEYRISHGRAVLMGLKEEIEISRKLSIIDRGFYEDFRELYRKIEEIVGKLEWTYNKDSYLWLDKKREGEVIGMFLIKKPGLFEYKELDMKFIKACLLEKHSKN